MKTSFLKYIALIGFIGILYSCEKDEEQVFMKETPVAPSIVTMPDLALLRDNGSDTLQFIATPVDPGFAASARYFLEVDEAGNNFASPLVLFNGVKANVIKMTISELNTLLLRKFTADATSDAEFRMRSVLVVDGGEGAAGTGSQPFQYISAVVPAEVTIYGLPRLDLINSGVDQKIESPLGNGIYSGYVKLSSDNAFTLKDPDTDVVYGVSAGALAEDGAGILVGNSGYYMLTADVNAMTYSLEEYMIGLVGDATPNGWDAPDTKMDYDAQSATWYITLDLIDGEIKFRKNDGWAWNLGGLPDTPVALGESNELVQGGANLAVTAGNYTITLTINSEDTGSATIVKND